MRNNNIISSSVKCFQIGSKTWSSTFIAFVVMLLVSFFLFSVGLAPFSSSFSSFGVFGGGGGREEHDLGNSGGGEEKVNVSSFRDGDALSFALPPSFPPSPLPEPSCSYALLRARAVVEIHGYVLEFDPEVLNSCGRVLRTRMQQLPLVRRTGSGRIAGFDRFPNQSTFDQNPAGLGLKIMPWVY